MTEQKLTQTVY